MDKKYKILFGVTGSVAAYKAPKVLRTLLQHNCEVKVIATEYALSFIGKDALRGCLDGELYTDLFGDTRLSIPHIHLANWADCFVIAPISAGALARCALGMASDLLSATFIALPDNLDVILAPSMNANMFSSHQVQRNLKFLKETKKNNICIVDPIPGQLDGKDDRPAAMQNPEKIAQIVLERMENKLSRK